ncbi:MAG: outer membrane beta-barrel protein [Verrucomicrobia bacterium]|nr:outer membrane beta-barrel protein [Verrucomicrobiota bacterium]
MNKLRGNRAVTVMLTWMAGAAAAVAQMTVPQGRPLEETRAGQIGGVSAQQRHFAYGVTIRESYDSNVTTQQDDQISSFITTFGPDLHFAWSSPTTDVAVHYVYWATYYEHRPGGNQFDQSHDFTFDLSHEFSPRFRVSMMDEFRPGFEPELESGTLQRQGDYIQNRLLISTAYSMGGRWELPVTFEHFFMDYEDGQVSNILDRQTYNGSLGVRYNLNSQTRFGALYGLGMTTYEGVNRDATAHTFSFNVNHAFTPRLSLDARAGAQMSFFETVGNAELNPDIAISLNYALGPRTVFTGQFSARVQPTEVVQYLHQRTYVFMFGATHQFTSRLTAGANVLLIPSDFDPTVRTDPADLPTGTAGATQGGHEDTVQVGLNLSYQFNMHWRAEVGATHTAVSSSFAGRGYDRDIGYIQTRIGF